MRFSTIASHFHPDLLAPLPRPPPQTVIAPAVHKPTRMTEKQTLQSANTEVLVLMRPCCLFKITHVRKSIFFFPKDCNSHHRAHTPKQNSRDRCQTDQIGYPNRGSEPSCATSAPIERHVCFPLCSYKNILSSRLQTMSDHYKDIRKVMRVRNVSMLLCHVFNITLSTRLANGETNG